jgi:hypothetical protein
VNAYFQGLFQTRLKLGYTENHSILHLKNLILENGGDVRYEFLLTNFSFYFNKTITHIICRNLSDANTRYFSKKQDGSRKVNVVLPNWVSDSCSEGKRLPESKYNVLSEKTHAEKGTLSAFFTTKTTSYEDIVESKEGKPLAKVSKPQSSILEPNPEPQVEKKRKKGDVNPIFVDNLPQGHPTSIPKWGPAIKVSPKKSKQSATDFLSTLPSAQEALPTD